jgi:hypothetical protein
VLGRLFTTGEIASRLSPTARDTLMQKLVQERLGADVGTIEQNLFEGLIKLTDDSLKSVHLRNFYVTTDFEPHPTSASFLAQKTTITFRILTSHLRPNRAIQFPYTYSYRIIVPVDISTELSDKDFLLAFALTVDGNKLGEPHVSRVTKDALCTIKLEFKQEFELTSDDTGIAFNYRAAALKSDNTSISRVRYPTRGFAKTIHYTEDFDYDCTWFASIGQKVGGPPNGSTSEPTPSGLTTRRDSWVLPGEGVAIYWSPKHRARTAVTDAMTR